MCSIFYVVLSYTFRNLKLIRLEANGFYDVVSSKTFVCWGLIVPRLYLEVSYINQDPILDTELCSLFNMKCTSFVVDSFFKHCVCGCVL